MRTRLTIAIIVVLLVAVLYSSMERRRPAPAPAPKPPKQLKAPEIIELHPTLAQITNSEISFFDPNGIALVGYVEKRPGEITLYSDPQGATALGDVINPLTKEKADAYVRSLREKAAAEVNKRETDEAKAKEQAMIEKIMKDQEVEKERLLERSNAVIRAQAELQEYRERYLAMNSSFDRAVLIVDERHSPNAALSSSIADSFSKGGAKSTPALFKPAFVRDGLFDKIFAGDSEAAKRLPLANFARSIVLGRQSVEYATLSNPQDIVSATMTLELAAVSSRDLQSANSQTLRSVGAGFNREEARIAAEERILQQLTNGVLSKLDQALSQQ